LLQAPLSIFQIVIIRAGCVLLSGNVNPVPVHAPCIAQIAAPVSQRILREREEGIAIDMRFRQRGNQAASCISAPEVNAARGNGSNDVSPEGSSIVFI